ncbi:hypothetical protein [Ammoniphilus sp. CFH 90114]|uniref:hypothetical protein n=1 Tax=Ammoniphilus sp. CFH 90114 TaxID=2493665 RepID=UPI00100EB6DA|nr:hypothetical protein [Ammoniphilus sp. CFH 90114]RXT07830.1 hypothetical protein EIZ39_10395 [Ammoniphilus sp. CFH 90114]
MLKNWGKKVFSYLRNERGAQAIEYVAVAALVVALLGTIITMIQGDNSIATAVLNKLRGFVNQW